MMVTNFGMLHVLCVVGCLVGNENCFMPFTKNHGEPAWLDTTDDLLGCHELQGEKAQI
jgi:hypothetical protein